MSKQKKRWSEMTTEELERATKKYDKPFGGWDEFKPLTKKDREIHRRARLRGRPRVGKGAKRVLITMERGLLKQVDDAATRWGMNRSQLIAQGVQSILTKRAG
jgi:hypothetical protein